MFSFGKNLVYGKNCCIQHIDMNKILVETDGKKDVVLCDVINKISDIKHEQNASPIIYNNTQRFIKNEQIA